MQQFPVDAVLCVTAVLRLEFQGILASRIAMPHMLVAPANVSPAPMNIAIYTHLASTRTDNTVPISTMIPAISLTCLSRVQRQGAHETSW